MKPSIYQVEAPLEGALYVMPKPSGEWLAEDITALQDMGISHVILAHDGKIKVTKVPNPKWVPPIPDDLDPELQQLQSGGRSGIVRQQPNCRE